MDGDAQSVTLPQVHPSPEARVRGEALVATITAHVQRYPAMSWADVQAVLRVLERAAVVAMEHERGQGGKD